MPQTDRVEENGEFEVFNSFRRESFRKFNNAFALISVISLLVFVYIIVVKLQAPYMLLGATGLVVLLTIVLSLIGYLYGYLLIKNLLKMAIDSALDSKKKDYLKSIFISIISHDLRNFLGALQINLQNIQDGYLGPVTEKQTASLKDCDEAINRIEAMATQLLDITRMETGAVKLRLSDVRVKHLVEEQIASLRPLIDEKKIAVLCRCAQDLTVQADQERLSRAVYHLIYNAIRHTSFGRSIEIAAEPKRPHVQIEVVHEGEILSEEEARYLFEGFSKRPDNYFEIKDYGLGLSTARSIIHLHGGRIWTENIAGSGCKFAFTIPINPSAHVPERPST